ncbi:MAG TPA: YbjN domain-containing protein [Acetobacteraceae bacterium]|nr:YbjN domain-containing protein [Acetobacteraceae bacterium]
MRWICALIVGLALPLAAQGETLPDGGVTGPEVASVLRHAGYPSDPINDRAGTPVIHSSTGKVLFNVNFYQCNAELRCASIQFIAEYRHKGVAPAVIAAWNREKHFGRAWQDRYGNSWVAMDVETSHGMTTEALAANISRWITVLNGFGAFLNE